MVLANDRMGQETMMDTAERYLEELAKRCMVQVKLYEEGLPSITRFKSCRLHDLLRDLCLDRAKEENLYKVIDLGHQSIGVPSSNSSPAMEKHYRFVIHYSRMDFGNCIPLPKGQTKHLRSLICGNLGIYEFVFRLAGKINFEVSILKMLRVLVIESCDLSNRRCRFFKSPLKCIGHLIHLRCLSLKRSRISKLPSSLHNLNYLETLDLRGGFRCSRITIKLWKLGHLRHLYLPLCFRFVDCKLSFDMLGKQLEILETVSNRQCNIKYLSKLTYLRSLKVVVHKNLEDVDQIISHISSMKYIRFTSLTILNCDFGTDSSSYNNKGLAVLQKSLFCKNIRELEIVGILCKQLPDYQPDLFPSSGLTELKFHCSNIEEDPMPTLQKFPNLRKLILTEGSFQGKEMICRATGFPQLKVLEFYLLVNLEKWEVDEGAMSKLSSLVIYGCFKLEMIPDGLRFITTLSEVTIRGMPEEFRNRVRIVNGVEGPDFDKIRHVPSVNIH